MDDWFAVNEKQKIAYELGYGEWNKLRAACLSLDLVFTIMGKQPLAQKVYSSLSELFLSGNFVVVTKGCNFESNPRYADFGIVGSVFES